MQATTLQAKMSKLLCQKSNGVKRTRTVNLCNATLYQLSYDPKHLRFFCAKRYFIQLLVLGLKVKKAKIYKQISNVRRASYIEREAVHQAVLPGRFTRPWTLRKTLVLMTRRLQRTIRACNFELWISRISFLACLVRGSTKRDEEETWALRGLRGLQAHLL